MKDTVCLTSGVSSHSCLDGIPMPQVCEGHCDCVMLCVSEAE